MSSRLTPGVWPNEAFDSVKSMVRPMAIVIILLFINFFLRLKFNGFDVPLGRLVPLRALLVSEGHELKFKIGVLQQTPDFLLAI